MIDVQIPDTYQAAIKDAMEQGGKTVSTLRVKDVLNKLPDNYQDTVSCQFYLRAYKAQNKRVSKLSQLLDAAKEAMIALNDDELLREQLSAAISNFDKTPIEGEF